MYSFVLLNTRFHDVNVLKWNRYAFQIRQELQEVEKELQEQQVERERHRRLQEQEILALKEQVNAAAVERSSLLEQCSSLEARRSHAQRYSRCSKSPVLFIFADTAAFTL